MLAVGSRLAQVRPSNTDFLEAFSTNVPNVEVTTILVANTTGVAATFRLCHSIGATDVTDETTALYWDKSVNPNDTFPIRAEAQGSGIFVGNRLLDKLFVRSGTANALTFTFYGVSANVADAAISINREAGA